MCNNKSDNNMFGGRLQNVCKTFSLHLGVWKKVNSLRSLAVNALIEFVNYTFYTTHEKEQSHWRFLQETCSKKIHTWQCNMKKVQHEESITWKECNTKKQHENSATRKRSNMKRVQQETSVLKIKCN